MTKEELDSLPPYERKAYLIWREMCSPDDERKPNVISYFHKRGNNETPVSSKVFTPKPISYDKTLALSEAFAMIKERMTTKQGKLRASLDKLTPYEVDMIAGLLYHLRQEWVSGEKEVVLTWKEYFWLIGK